MAPAKIFTDEMRAWVARHVKEGSYAELTERFNQRFGTTVGERSLQQLCYRIGLRNSDREAPIPWTAEHIDWIREHVAGRSFDELAEMFFRHFNMRVKSRAFKSYCHRHGLHNGMRGFNDPTRRTQYKAGMEPWNKGLKGVIKPNSGSFRKGKPSPHQKPVGTMVWNNRYGAWFVKTAEPNKWRSAAHVAWERANGRELGPRMVVIHADGDKSNLAPENLVAMTAAEWTSLFKNGLRVPGDADLTRCGAAWVKLRFAVKRRESERRQC